MPIRESLYINPVIETCAVENGNKDCGRRVLRE